jgi:leucyl-tRNA synthetase
MNHAKTFDAIDKLKEIESELHRLKNALELANRALEAEREACAKVCEEEIKRVKPIYSVTAENCVKAIRARGQE